jgi:hypothetical protein
MVVGITEAIFVYQWGTQVEINSTRMGGFYNPNHNGTTLYISGAANE